MKKIIFLLGSLSLIVSIGIYATETPKHESFSITNQLVIENTIENEIIAEKDNSTVILKNSSLTKENIVKKNDTFLETSKRIKR